MSTAPIKSHATTDSAAKLAVLQRRMAIVFTKDNAAKIAEDVKGNSAKIAEKIKESEALNEMKENAVKIAGKIKESEALNEMIKESTLDNLLVGKGTLDRLLAEEEEVWTPKGDRIEIETVPEDRKGVHGQAEKGPRDSKLNGGIWHEVNESRVLNAADYHPTGMIKSIHSIVQGRHSKNPIENTGSAEKKENMAPNPTPENEYLGQDSYMHKSSSYLKALGRTGGSTLVGIGSSSVITDMRLTQYFTAEKLSQYGELASGAGGAVLDMVKDPLARNVEIPYAQQHLAMKTGGQWTLASNRGWNSVRCGGESSNVEESGNGVGDYEKKLILELCPPDETKTDPNITCPTLLDALEEGNPWILRAKTLCVIETVLKVEAERVAGVGCDDLPYSDYFRRCSGPIEHLAKHPRESVNGPAKRVLVALGLIVVESPPLFYDAEAHPVAAAATAMTLPPSHAVASSAAIVGLAGTSLLSEFNTKAMEQMHYLQNAYQENKEKMLLQQTNFQAQGRVQVPSFSSWNPIPARSSTHENLLNAL